MKIGNHKGLSNQEIINYVKKNVKKKINLNYVNRRKGDVVSLVCNSEKAKNLLSWRAKNSNLSSLASVFSSESTSLGKYNVLTKRIDWEDSASLRQTADQLRNANKNSVIVLISVKAR